jgi:chromate reductase
VLRFTPNLIDDDGTVSVESTAKILRDYMGEFSDFIPRVLSVHPSTRGA